jgi:hypothetical protein
MEIDMTSSSAPLTTAGGRGSGSGAPNLPAGFTDTFTSRYIDTDELRLHAVTGGEGPPLLLVHGWPETWYAWCLLVPALARDVEVVQSVVIPGVGHFLGEEAPDEMLAASTAFLAPYRDRPAGLPTPRQPAADVTESLRG